MAVKLTYHFGFIPYGHKSYSKSFKYYWSCHNAFPGESELGFDDVRYVSIY